MPKAKQSHCKMFVLDTNVMINPSSNKQTQQRRPFRTETES